MQLQKGVASDELGVHKENALSAPEVPSRGWIVILISLYPFSLKVELRNSEVTLREKNFSDPT